MLRYVCVIFALLASFLVAGLSEDEIKQFHEQMSDISQECMKKLNISMDDFVKSKKTKDLSSINPCLFGCIMKGKGLIDDKGMFDGKHGIEMAKKIIKSPDDIAKLTEVMETCRSVNEQEVSDGDKGCERGILVRKCLMDNRSQMI